MKKLKKQAFLWILLIRWRK